MSNVNNPHALVGSLNDMMCEAVPGLGDILARCFGPKEEPKPETKVEETKEVPTTVVKEEKPKQESKEPKEEPKSESKPETKEVSTTVVKEEPKTREVAKSVTKEVSRDAKHKKDKVDVDNIKKTPINFTTSARVPRTKIVPISSGIKEPVNMVPYFNKDGAFCGYGVEVPDDETYIDQMSIKKIDNSKMISKYPELKAVESAIRELEGFDVSFTEENKLIKALIYINDFAVDRRSFTIDINGCMFNSKCKWFPVFNLHEEDPGYEAYPILDMNMDAIKKYISGGFADNPSSIKAYSLCSEDEIAVNTLFDLSTLPGLSDGDRKKLIETLYSIMSDKDAADKLYGFHSRPRFHFVRVDSDKEFVVISQKGNEYNYGTGKVVMSEPLMEVTYKDGAFEVRAARTELGQ